MLDKTFSPADAEARLYEKWEQSGAFRAGRNLEARPYCIVIPPPNVTGSLHIGHALNNTLQDVLVRFERMRGRDVLWQPGTDHAGIATQMVVERLLESENRTDRRTMGREAFVRRVWQWKEESGGTIVRQLRRLGASCDWSRERFTMDEGLSRAVLRVFVTLYREGLIYRDKRLVNWDPKFQTAISDLEVVSKEIKGHLWHLRYPVEGEDGRFITVATTRPETMLGDTGVAVHPEDERYTDLVGKFCILPLVGRRIPIVADEYADPEQGSGAVKITPAHDFNDFEVGRRHDLAMINILDGFARINEAAPEAYRGLDRYEAREKVVADLEAQGLLAEIEDHTHMVPYGDRSDAVIEPWLTDQWYVDARTLAKPAIEAVERGETVFVPRNWEKTYFEWMRNIQPWCISRQLWWGHRIPAWYAEDGEIFVAESETEAHAAAEKHYGRKVELVQDEDVLDTWFSSALWPFSTLGWPDDTPELGRYYKTDVLITGFDIIFFWIARMMMMGLHFKKEVPFHTVYIHALVRDEKGQKMSKAKGNVVDPLALIDEFGADALRFTLAAMAAQGRDIKLAKSRIEGYRNFGTKLWNAARFCQMNGCTLDPGFAPKSVERTLNRWILSELTTTTDTVARELDAFRFNEAAGALYHFVWHVFCDWYLELAKPLLGGDDPDTETSNTAAFVLDHILVLLHPFMPFITEELWARLAEEQGRSRETMLIEARWPSLDVPDEAVAAGEEMNWLIGLVSSIRSVRSEMNVPPAAKIPLMVRGGNPDTSERLERHEESIRRLARIKQIEAVHELPPGAVQIVHGEATFILPLADVIDVNEEMKRLGKEISKLEADLKKMTAKLGNEKFLSNAPEEVIEEHRERQSGMREKLARLQGALDQISIGVA